MDINLIDDAANVILVGAYLVGAVHRYPWLPRVAAVR
jgi:hypothetical protein